MEKIFCIAFHKSGTSSMHAWFERAGLKSLHYPKHVDGLNYARLIRPVIDDNHEILRVLSPIIASHDAHSDAPWPGLYRELALVYPQARFILIRRDPESWWESLALDWQIDWVARRLTAFEWVQYRRTLELAPSALITRRHKDQFIKSYRRHMADVAQALPADRLLSFALDDQAKSEKLARFFRLQAEVPFPHQAPTSASRPLKKTLRTLRRRIFGSDLAVAD